jgi:hypothetical protein
MANFLKRLIVSLIGGESWSPTRLASRMGLYPWPVAQHGRNRRKTTLNMRSAVKEIYRVSPTRTIPIHFYHLEPGRINQPSLVQFTAASFRGVTPGTVKQQVEKRFRELIASDRNLPRIVVVAPSMGDPPGEIIAVESVGTPKRELIWLADASTGIV